DSVPVSVSEARIAGAALAPPPVAGCGVFWRLGGTCWDLCPDDFTVTVVGCGSSFSLLSLVASFSSSCPLISASSESWWGRGRNLLVDLCTPSHTAATGPILMLRLTVSTELQWVEVLSGETAGRTMGCPDMPLPPPVYEYRVYSVTQPSTSR
ncbi:hypothetical protein GBAR_LOCUS22326, partial [Geodia barretti]